MALEKDPHHDDTYIFQPAGWSPRFAKVNVGKHRCGHIEDGIALDLCDCQEPNHCQWHPGGVIAFEDLEAIYFAARKLRRARPTSAARATDSEGSDGEK